MILFIKNNHKLIISFIILIVVSLSFFHLKNNHREIIDGPDDKYHYLMKPTNLKLCEDKKCFFENFYKYSEISKLDKDQRWMMDRQIHRIVVSYHSLYTFIVDKLTNEKNLFQMQFKINILGTITTLLFLLFYLNKFFTNKNLIILITLILSTHHYSYYQGIQNFVPFVLSAFIGSLAMVVQYKKKLLSYVFYIICILLHKVGLIISLIAFSVYYLDNFAKLIDESDYLKKIWKFIKKEFLYVLLFFVIFISCFFIEYDFYQKEKLDIFSTYNTNYSLNSILLNLKANYTQVFMRSWDTFILRINPLLFLFFISSFLISLSPIFRPLKIFTVLLFGTCILFIYGIEHNSFGARIWPLIVTNYLILSFACLFELSKKSRLIKLIKYLIIITLPIHLFINLNQNIKEINSSIVSDNFYYNSENINKFKEEKLTDNKNFVYFNSSEATFYYYLISGFINKNFITSYSFPNLDAITDKISYVIKDNPLNILINNNTKIDFNDINGKNYLILQSGSKQDIKINNSEVRLNKGQNIVDIYDSNLKFENVDYSLRMIGIKLNEDQTDFWPWNTNLRFDYERSNFMAKAYYYDNFEKISYHLPTILRKIKINNGLPDYAFDTPELDKCSQQVISDKDSSIILKVICN